MPKRWIRNGLLVLTLVLPVALYIFLQSFGKNQYEVPIIYPEGITHPLEGCQPSSVSDQLSSFFYSSTPEQPLAESDIQGRINVFSFMQNTCDKDAIMLREVARVCNKYRDNARVGTVSILLDSMSTTDSWSQLVKTYQLKEGRWQLLKFNKHVSSLIRCGFNLETTSCDAAQTVVLLDGKLRIRGYFGMDDPQEVDRLLTEIEILLINEEDV